MLVGGQTGDRHFDNQSTMVRVSRLHIDRMTAGGGDTVTEPASLRQMAGVCVRSHTVRGRMSDQPRVIVEVADHVAEVKLNRGEKHNGLDYAMFDRNQRRDR